MQHAVVLREGVGVQFDELVRSTASGNRHMHNSITQNTPKNKSTKDTFKNNMYYIESSSSVEIDTILYAINYYPEK